MRLSITGEKLIKDLRKDFNLVYPYLQLEFFENANPQKAQYPALKTIDHEKTLGEAWIPKLQKGAVEINDSTTVLELETVLKNDFGLLAQVFRKSGNIWLETTMTDDWTLKQQNDHGREISMSYDHESQQQEDFDLNRDV